MEIKYILTVYHWFSNCGTCTIGRTLALFSRTRRNLQKKLYRKQYNYFKTLYYQNISKVRTGEEYFEQNYKKLRGTTVNGQGYMVMFVMNPWNHRISSYKRTRSAERQTSGLKVEENVKDWSSPSPRFKSQEQDNCAPHHNVLRTTGLDKRLHSRYSVEQCRLKYADSGVCCSRTERESRSRRGRRKSRGPGPGWAPGGGRSPGGERSGGSSGWGDLGSV